jgi:hypothetical protein
MLQTNGRKRAARARSNTPALLKGLLFGPAGAAMSPTQARKGCRLYRCYVSQTTLKQAAGTCPVRRVPAAAIEAAVIGQVRELVRAPEIVARTWKQVRGKLDRMTEAGFRTALHQFDALWDQLFPAEQTRIVHLLVERIDLMTPAPISAFETMDCTRSCKSYQTSRRTAERNCQLTVTTIIRRKRRPYCATRYRAT